MAMEPEREVALASDEELLFSESAEDGSSAYEGDVSLMCSAGSEVEGGGEGSEQGGLRLLLESEFGEEPRDESTDRESEERSITPRASAWLQSTDGFTLSAGASSAPLDRITPKHDSVSADVRPSTDAPSVGAHRDWATDRGRLFGTDPKREAELIGARSKVAKLEVEVDSLRRAAKRTRMEEEDSRDHSRRELCVKMESLHRVLAIPSSYSVSHMNATKLGGWVWYRCGQLLHQSIYAFLDPHQRKTNKVHPAVGGNVAHSFSLSLFLVSFSPYLHTVSMYKFFSPSFLPPFSPSLSSL